MHQVRETPPTVTVPSSNAAASYFDPHRPDTNAALALTPVRRSSMNGHALAAQLPGSSTVANQYSPIALIFATSVSKEAGLVMNELTPRL